MAVYVSNITIAEFSGSIFDSTTASRESTSDSFSYGDLVSNDAKNGEVDVVGEADKDQFLGVSLKTIDGSIDTVSKVNIATKCVIRCLLAAAQDTIYFGEAAAWSTGANGTTWSFANTTTEAIVHCRDESIVAAAYGLFLVNPYTIRAVTGLGFFEIVT